MMEWQLTAKYHRSSDTVVIAATSHALQSTVEISAPMQGKYLADALDYIAGSIRRIEGESAV